MCVTFVQELWKAAFDVCDVTGATWRIHLCDMTHSYIWHTYEWVSRMCNMTHLYVCHTCAGAVESCVWCVWRNLRDMTYSLMWHDAFIWVWHNLFMRVTWLIHVCNMTHSCVSHDLFMCVTLVQELWKAAFDVCDVWPTRRDVFACVTWRIHMSDITYSCVWHDSFMCATWLIHMCVTLVQELWKAAREGNIDRIRALVLAGKMCIYVYIYICVCICIYLNKCIYLLRARATCSMCIYVYNIYIYVCICIYINKCICLLRARATSIEFAPSFWRVIGVHVCRCIYVYVYGEDWCINMLRARATSIIFAPSFWLVICVYVFDYVYIYTERGVICVYMCRYICICIRRGLI